MVIGAVSIDIHRAEREFNNLNLSDINVVKYLLIYRDKVDIYMDAEIDRHYNNAGVAKNVNQELIHLYAALDMLIKSCGFNSEQLELIRKVSIGYTFKDIAEMSSEAPATPQNVKRRFETICKTIVSMNNEVWLVWVSKNKLEESLKNCNKCKKKLPMTDKFFGKDIRNIDGFKGICKNCETITRK